MSATESESVERFGEICAVLGAGRRERAPLLANAGLDESAWAALCGWWAPRIQGDRETAARFGVAYAASLLRDPRGRAPNPDETLVGTSRAAGPDLPFRPAGGARDSARDPLDVTADAPLNVIPGAALPFTPPAQPRKRLIRFDPQTGCALPEPIWVDLPKL